MRIFIIFPSIIFHSMLFNCASHVLQLKLHFTTGIHRRYARIAYYACMLFVYVCGVNLYDFIWTCVRCAFDSHFSQIPFRECVQSEFILLCLNPTYNLQQPQIRRREKSNMEEIKCGKAEKQTCCLLWKRLHDPLNALIFQLKIWFSSIE